MVVTQPVVVMQPGIRHLLRAISNARVPLRLP
jgi:hypothetical protein